MIYEIAQERPDFEIGEVEVPEMNLSATETEFRVASGASRKTSAPLMTNWNDSLLECLLRCGFWK